MAPRKSRRWHSPREHGSVFKEASAGVTDPGLSRVACGVCGLGQVPPVVCAPPPRRVNGNDVRLPPDARANTGNPRKAFSRVLDRWGLLWAWLRSRHSPGKSWERDRPPGGAEAMKGSGARERHSGWALASPRGCRTGKRGPVPVPGLPEQGCPRAAPVQTCVSLAPWPPAPSPRCR